MFESVFGETQNLGGNLHGSMDDVASLAELESDLLGAFMHRGEVDLSSLLTHKDDEELHSKPVEQHQPGLTKLPMRNAVNGFFQFGRTAPIVSRYEDPVTYLKDYSDPLPYKLVVEGVPSYSRVETQIKLRFFMVPNEGIQREPMNVKWVHLPVDCIEREKNYLAEGFDLTPCSNQIMFLEAFVLCNGTNKTTFVCNRCVSREQRRASRRKSGISYNVLWRNNPNRRAILFNNKQIVHVEPNSEQIAFELASRVVCYCRHHGANDGFNFLFVMKNHEGRVVAKSIAGPINIMDKKSHHDSSRRSTTLTQKDTVNFGVTSNNSSSDCNSESPMPGAVASRVNAEGIEKLNTTPGSQEINVERNDVSNSAYRLDSVSSSYSSSIFESTPSGLKRSLSNDLSGQMDQQHFPSPCSMPDEQKRISIDGFELTSKNLLLDENQGRNDGLEKLIDSSIGTLDPKTIFLGGDKQAENFDTSSKPGHRVESIVRGVGSKRRIYDQDYVQRTTESPFIEKVVPGQGPVSGGVEVTILGKNFSEEIQVKFGDNIALSVRHWSDTTLVVCLPPSSIPGQVYVTLLNPSQPVAEYDVEQSKNTFTYINDTDRQLMELALQIVGLKLHGKLDEARNIAKSIIDSMDGGTGNAQQYKGIIANSGTYRTHVLEELLINAFRAHGKGTNISLCNSVGRTLLHLTCNLGLLRLAALLIRLGAKINVQDMFGYTPLHFACLNGDLKLMKLLLACGAKSQLISKNGVTPRDLYIQNGYSTQEVMYMDEAEYTDTDSDDSNKCNREQMSDKQQDDQSGGFDALDHNPATLIHKTTSTDSGYELDRVEHKSALSQGDSIEGSGGNETMDSCGSIWNKMMNKINDELPKYEDLFPRAPSWNFGSKFKTDKIDNDVLLASQDSRETFESNEDDMSCDEELDTNLNKLIAGQQNFKNDKMLLFFWLPIMVILLSGLIMYQFTYAGKFHKFSNMVQEYLRKILMKILLGNERMKESWMVYMKENTGMFGVRC